MNNLIYRLKNFYMSLKNRHTSRLVSGMYHKSRVVRCGSDTGGFFVLPPEDKNGLVVMSFGIGEDLSFSEDVAKLLNPTIYAFDPTPRSVKFVKGHPLYNSPKFKFFEFGISDSDEAVEFHLPKNPDYVSGSMEKHEGLQSESIQVQMNRFATICGRLDIAQVDILKLDIEGSEFKVIPDVLKSGIPVAQICVETHERFFDDGSQKLESLVTALADGGYKCVAVDYIENVFTFVKASTLF